MTAAASAAPMMPTPRMIHGTAVAKEPTSGSRGLVGRRDDDLVLARLRRRVDDGLDLVERVLLAHLRGARVQRRLLVDDAALGRGRRPDREPDPALPALLERRRRRQLRVGQRAANGLGALAGEP